MQEFYEQFKEDSLVVLKWLGVQSSSNVPGNLKAIRALLDHPAVNLSNPNTNYSLFLGFVRSPVNFHAADGSGYSFMGDMILKVGGGPIIPAPVLNEMQTSSNTLAAVGVCKCWLLEGTYVNPNNRAAVA